MIYLSGFLEKRLVVQIQRRSGSHHQTDEFGLSAGSGFVKYPLQMGTCSCQTHADLSGCVGKPSSR